MKKINVLIAENQRNTRHGLKALLQFSPFIDRIWEAEDGEEAIKMIEHVNPDLVITAANIPIIEGVCITRWIKKNRPGTKVIILTLYHYYEDEALAAGANRFLVKGTESISIEEEISSLFPDELGVPNLPQA
ncbi:MAG: response regulator [Chloroflexota bacterium]|nr:response regulator [Chloroflexota bacterium]